MPRSKPTILGLLLTLLASACPADEAPKRDGLLDLAAGDSSVVAFPDGPGGDSAPDLALADSSVHDSIPSIEAGCTPNSFLTCVGTTMVRCDGAGKAINISCAPFLCNATHKRCNECAPGSDSCDGTQSVACSAAGTKTATSCLHGCNTATGLCYSCPTTTYYADSDKDSFGDAQSPLKSCTQPVGYVLDKTDCDDADKDAFPGQTKWFKVPTLGNKDYDFNCDKVETLQETKIFSCGGGCQGEGWSSTKPPACGASEYWEVCFKDPYDPACDSNGYPVTQACH